MKESPKGGFRLLKYTGQPGTVMPLASGPIEYRPIPRSSLVLGEKAAVKGCIADVRQEKKTIVVDLKSTGCDPIIKQITDLTPGGKKFWLKHFRTDGQRLDDSAKKAKSGD